MARNTFTLFLIVWLCFFVPIFSQSFSLTCGNIAAVSATAQCTLTLEGYIVESGPIQVTISSSQSSVVVVQNAVVTFSSDQSSTVNLRGVGVGISSITISSSVSGYALPDPQSVFVFLNANFDGNKNIYPGKTVQATVRLDASPAKQVIIQVSSDPAVTLSPSSFTFNAGESPYSQIVVISSIQPGTYLVTLSSSGDDAVTGLVSTIPVNLTLVVNSRLVYTTIPSPSYLNNLQVGSVSGPVLVNLDIAPENGLTINLIPSDPSVVVTPATLSFSPSSTFGSFSILGKTAGSYNVSSQLGGTDQDKYGLATSTLFIKTVNRTITVPAVFPSLIVGTASPPLTAYIISPPSAQLILTPSSPNIVFTPSTLTFGPSDLVATFTATASAGAAGLASITYDISGSDSPLYSVPPLSSVTITNTLRNVNPVFAVSLASFPVGVLVPGNVTLDVPTPTSFSIQLRGANLFFSPSLFTFQNAIGTLSQSFLVNATQLGSSRIYFDITGTDASLVSPISSLAITVVPKASPVFNIIQNTFVGAITQGTINLPSPVSSSLTITLSSIPSNAATFSPAVVTLQPGAVSFEFSLTGVVVGPLFVQAGLSGDDSAFYGQTANYEVVISPVQVIAASVIPNLVVGVTYSISISLAQSTSLPVTVTPSSSLLSFNPPSVILTGASSACLTFTPLTATTQGSVITFTVDDHANFVAPNPLAIPSISKRTFSINSSALQRGLVVGVPSAPCVVTLSLPPIQSVTLTLSSGALTFNPSSLTFTPSSTALSFTVTATAPNAQGAKITWVVSGNDTNYYSTPAQITGLSIQKRSITVPTSVDTTQVGYHSKPFLITTNYAPTVGLTITPSSPGLSFSPSVLTLSPGSPFSSFTALLASWGSNFLNSSPQNFSISYSVSGPDALWYQLSSTSTSFSVRQSTVSIGTIGSQLYDIPSNFIAVTLEHPPSDSLELSICGPSSITIQPSPLKFGPNDKILQFSILANSYSTLSPIPTNVPISWQLSGSSASSYVAPSPTTLSLAVANTIIVSGFPTTLRIGSMAVFSVVLPSPNFAFTSVTLTCSSNALTFTPNQVTFIPNRLRFYISATADQLLRVADSQFSDTLTLSLSGPDALRFTVPAPSSFTITKKTITIAYPTLTTVGSYLTGTITLSQPPSSSLILTADLSAGLSISPGQITFSPTTTVASFLMFATTSTPTWVSWEVSGIDGGFYVQPSGTTFNSVALRTIDADGLVQVSPDSSNQIYVTLSTAPTNGITVVPVLPQGFSTPSVLNFAPGQARLAYSVSVNASDDFNQPDTFYIFYTITGPDSNLYQPPAPTSVTVKLGYFIIPSLNPTTVGVPLYIEISTTIVSPNGFSLVPNAAGAVFDPPQLQFGPDVVGKLTITPLIVGTVTITWTIIGPDAWLYLVPSPITLTSSIRTFFLQLDATDLVIGVPYTAALYPTYPPPTDVTVSLIAPCFTISPSTTLSFTSSVAVQQFYYSPAVTCEDSASILGTISGTDAAWYAPIPNYADFYVARRGVTFQGSMSMVSGILSPPIVVSLDLPGDITIIPNAPGCDIEPPSLVFSNKVESISITVLCNSASTTGSVNIPVQFSLLGSEADLYELNPITFVLGSNLISIPSGPLLALSGQPYAYYLTISYLPSSIVTITPQSDIFAFDPPVVTFSDNIYASLVVTPLSFFAAGNRIYYNISGANIDGIELSSQYTQFYSFSGVFSHPLDMYELTVGTKSDALTIQVDPPPQHDVTLKLTAPGCIFSPFEAVFSSSSSTVLITFSCVSPGSHWVRFDVEGTDAVHYSIPTPVQVNIALRTVSASVAIDEITVFQNSTGYVSLSVPTENGLTITPNAPAVIFTPSSFYIPPGSSDFAFSFQPTQVTGGSNTPLTFSISGVDAILYSAPSETDIFVAYKRVLPLEDYSSIIVGAPTNVFVLQLDYPPLYELVVQPFGAGLIFRPSQLIFTPGVTSISFTVEATVDGEELYVYYNVSGWDAPYYYVSPSASTVTTELLRLELVYNSDVTVGVLSEPAIILATNSPSVSITLQLTGANIAFDTPSLTIGSDSPYAIFRFTTSFVGTASIGVVVSGPGANQFIRTLWKFTLQSYPREFLVPNSVPDLYASVTSSSLSIGVEHLPPSDIVLTPSAPNVAFSPANLVFTPSTFHVEFNVTSTFPAEQNQLFSDSKFQHTVTWSIAGDNSLWYTPPPVFTFYALPRDLKVTSPFVDFVYLNVPVVLYITSTYPATNNLTIIPSGPFNFEPAIPTLLSGDRSVSVVVTPIVTGSYAVRFSLSGPDARLYQSLDNVQLVVQKWHFEMPSFSQSFSYDQWNSPLVFRPHIVPPNNVTLTLSSNYLDFNPPTLFFSSVSPSSQVSLQLKGLGYSRTDNFQVNFWVGGADAALFYTPDPISFTWEVSTTRTLVVSAFPNSLAVGVESPPITISIPNYPLGELIITPFASVPNAIFSPASISLSRSSTSLSASFTVLVTHPQAPITINFALDGSDAIYYSPGFGYTIPIEKRKFGFPDFPDLVVGVPSQPIAISLAYPTPQRVTLSLSSPSISFDPPVLTFSPTQSSVPVILTGGTVGDAVPVSVWIDGEDANLYDSATVGPITIVSRTWVGLPSSVTITPGKPTTVVYTVSAPPNTNITLTPVASGITFSPATLTITGPNSSGAFTLWGEVGGTVAIVATTVSGPDAGLFPPVATYQAFVNFLTVTPTIGLQDETEMELGDTVSVVFGVSATPRSGLYLTPSATGLSFSPPTLYFAPGVLYAHANFTADYPGSTQVTYALSGPDRSLYIIDSTFTTTVTINQLSLSIGEVDLIIVGSTSAYVPIIAVDSKSNQRAPPLPVFVSFIISPPEAVTVLPSNNISLTSPTFSYQVQFQPNIYSQAFFVQPVLSGPGASYFADPAPVILSTIKRDFLMTSLINYLVSPESEQIVVGLEAGPFGITARSVPTGVFLYLSAPGLRFIPSVLRFVGTFDTLYFTIIPTQAMQTYITFAIDGPDAQLFLVPPVSPIIRITHDFAIPPLPAVIVGQTSPPLLITVTSPLSSPVILEPFADCVSFNPPYLLFSPNTTQQTFKFTGRCVNYNMGANINPVVTQNAEQKYSNPPSFTPVVWNVREAGEANPYELSLPLLRGTQSINIVPATFKVSFSPLFIGMKNGYVNISVTSAPRSDVVLTLVANNLNFDPPYATFTHSKVDQALVINVVHSDFKDSQNIPFVVDYIVSGYNWEDYIPPAQTYLGVQQGQAPVVGAICRNSASSIYPVYLGTLFVTICVMLM